MTKEESKQRIEQLVRKFEEMPDYLKKDYNEEQTKKNLILPLFEALGWDTQSDEVKAEENISGGRVDYALKLNGITKFYVEAKPIKADLDKKDYQEQLIEYAYNKGVTWGILTDFEGLKIFNALEKTPSPINFTVGDYLKEFDLLWYLSKESFETGALDQWAQRVGLKSPRVPPIGDQLAKDLTTWRDTLGKFIKSWHDTLMQEQVDEAVQKFLDRLIFIRVAEDRGLEDTTLLPLVHDKTSIPSKLNKIFREFDAKYDSTLFRKHFSEELDLEGISNNIGEIIQRMYTTKDDKRYNFSLIEADILGAVYEQYLGTIQRSGEETSKRKEQGIFYTPKFITDYIVQNTLGKVLQEVTSVDEARKLKILDPACGSGSFLIKGFEVLDAFYQKADVSEEKRRDYILKGNLYGVDLDPKAVELAQLNLMLAAAKKRELLPELQENLKVGNSLISGSAEELKNYFGKDWEMQSPFNWKEEFPGVFEQGGFDVIIGNPPYVFARGGNFDERTKKYYYDNFPIASYQLNTYLLFIDKAFRLLKKGGYFGFIIPNTWLTIDTFSPLRKFLLEETNDLHIINIFDKVFGGANVDTCLLLFKKGNPNNITLGEFREGKMTTVGSFPISHFKKGNFVINVALVKNKDKAGILDKVKRGSKQLSDFATVSTGLKAYQEGKGKPMQTAQVKNSRAFHANSRKDKTYKKYLEGRDVGRYYLGWSGEYLSYGDWLAEPRKSVPFNGERILVRQIPSPLPYSINAVFTEEGFLNDINSMVVFDFKIAPLYLLAVLNSKITTFWFANIFGKLQREIFPQFKVKELAMFPVPGATEEEHRALAAKASEVLELNKRFQEVPKNSNKSDVLRSKIEKLDKEIDKLVYKLYGLTPEEIKIVEESTD